MAPGSLCTLVLKLACDHYHTASRSCEGRTPNTPADGADGFSDGLVMPVAPAVSTVLKQAIAAGRTGTFGVEHARNLTFVFTFGFSVALAPFASSPASGPSSLVRQLCPLSDFVGKVLSLASKFGSDTFDFGFREVKIILVVMPFAFFVGA